MAALRLSCLARNGRSPGEESLSDAVAAQAIEAQPSSGQISQREVEGPRRTASSGEVVADPEGPAQDGQRSGRRERKRSVGEGCFVPVRSRPAMTQSTEFSSVAPRSGSAGCKSRGKAAAAVRSSSTIRASRRPSSPTCSMIRMAGSRPSSARVAARGTASKPMPPILARPSAG